MKSGLGVPLDLSLSVLDGNLAAILRGAGTVCDSRAPDDLVSVHTLEP
jgi:hypothetical protein